MTQPVLKLDYLHITDRYGQASGSIKMVLDKQTIELDLSPEQAHELVVQAYSLFQQHQQKLAQVLAEAQPHTIALPPPAAVTELEDAEWAPVFTDAADTPF